MSSSNCCFLTCIQIFQETGQVVWYSHFLMNFPQFIVIHTVKGFDIVNKAEIDVFLELSWFLNHPADVGNLISGSSAFSKTSLNIWKFTVHILLKAHLENFELYFTSVWDECNCVVAWTLFGIAFLWDWKGPRISHFSIFLRMETWFSFLSSYFLFLTIIFTECTFFRLLKCYSCEKKKLLTRVQSALCLWHWNLWSNQHFSKVK